MNRNQSSYKSLIDCSQCLVEKLYPYSSKMLRDSLQALYFLFRVLKSVGNKKNWALSVLKTLGQIIFFFLLDLRFQTIKNKKTQPVRTSSIFFKKEVKHYFTYKKEMTALSKIDLFFIQRTRTFSRPHICGYGVEIVKIANRVLILFWSEIIIPRFSSTEGSHLWCFIIFVPPPPPPPNPKTNPV